jgi:hypothetical protein
MVVVKEQLLLGLMPHFNNFSQQEMMNMVIVGKLRMQVCSIDILGHYKAAL